MSKPAFCICENKDANQLRRHAMLSYISSLPIQVLGILDTEANRFYALINCTVTAQLICVFVFASAKSSFSHGVEDMLHENLTLPLMTFQQSYGLLMM